MDEALQTLAKSSQLTQYNRLLLDQVPTAHLLWIPRTQIALDFLFVQLRKHI